MRYCPICKTDLNDDDQVFVHGGVITGCDYCTQTMWADEYFSERELTDEDYRDQALWDAAKDARYGL